ncbi:hypothetical protein AA0114_g5514 [Alternaria tenuissima]|uniref:Uncharacterized protein n=1 Tax=Alternaria tenuissima TaxID=119927 RepID=A0A4Q4MH02_9PLEO|nr:hypothetical protein AA0114_g5514 [Alternaria tenuissima]
MGPTRCNSMYVLNHMEATVDFLMDFSYYKTQSQRERYRLALCSAMSAALSVNDILAYLRDGPYDDSISVRKNMGRADTIGMLAAAAAVNGHKYASSIIYERFEDSRRQWDQLYETIDTCMYKQRATMLPTFMGWYLKSCDSGRAIYDAKYERCKWAIIRGELDVVRRCYNFKRAIKSDRQLEYFLETDATLGDATYTYEAGRIGAQGLSQGLVLAVQNGWLGAARLLIESGAQIKKSEYDDTVCAPALWHAVKRGHVDMVMLLLAYGVVIPAKNSKKHAGFWTLTMKRGTKMASLMEEAWMIRTRKAPVSKLNGIV